MSDIQNDVRLAQAGDTDAFARLYATVYKDMYHIALYTLKNSHDAADTVSDAVLDAFCSVKKLRDPMSFQPWIMKILSAKIKRRQKEYFSSADELPDDSCFADFSFESVELREAVDRLDTGSRLLLSLSVLGGYSSDEISRICDIKASTVRSRLSRIKDKLRLELSPEL